MTVEDLKRALAEILVREAQAEPDWPLIGKACLGLAQRAHDAKLFTQPSIALRFLDDYDIRKKDAAYAQGQRRQLQDFLAA